MFESAQDSADGGSLRVGGLEATELARRFGTPLYAYDADRVREQYERVCEALGPRVKVLYCLKANPSLALTALLQGLGAGAEVASAGEIHVARAAGQRGVDLQFAGPGKSDGDLRVALEVDLGCINLESEAEYEALVEVAREVGKRPRVALRINPEVGMAGSRMAMGGASRKFGVDVARVPALARRIVEEDVAELRGLHVYAGTQCFDASAWLGNAAGVFEQTRRLDDTLGRSLPGINFGGGFGVPIFEGDPVFDLDAAGRGLRTLIDRDPQPERQYFVELGRFLVATAGVYLTRVRYLKESQGRQHAILDGGMHHHAAAAGIGSVIRRAYPIRLCDHAPERAAGTYTVSGPLCTPADELARDASLPQLRPGDVLAVEVSGAYGLSFSNTMFLSHPTPAEVLVDQGEAQLIRDAGRPEDALRGQHRAELPPR